LNPHGDAIISLPIHIWGNVARYLMADVARGPVSSMRVWHSIAIDLTALSSTSKAIRYYLKEIDLFGNTEMSLYTSKFGPKVHFTNAHTHTHTLFFSLWSDWIHRY